MQADQVFTDVSTFAVALRDLHAQRRGRVVSGRSERAPRAALAQADRGKVLSKTGGRCHICGGAIDADDWQADHVLAHSTGGAHSVDNYLPAHSICNNYRWHYDAEEFQWILKLGVWLRTQIEKETAIGQEVGQIFCDHERRRAGRRKPVPSRRNSK
jgi:HNH endonuclease